MNHHSVNVVASDSTANSARPAPLPSSPRNPPRNAMHASMTTSHAGPRVYAPTFAPGGRRHARRKTRCNAVVNELAKKIVNTSPSNPVAFLTSSDVANASLAVVERVAADTEAVGEGGEDRRADALRDEGGDHDDEGEERDERLPGERDAAVDELDLEHPFPDSPHQPLLEPLTAAGDTCRGSRRAGAGWTCVRQPSQIIRPAGRRGRSSRGCQPRAADATRHPRRPTPVAVRRGRARRRCCGRRRCCRARTAARGRRSPGGCVRSTRARGCCGVL